MAKEKFDYRKCIRVTPKSPDFIPCAKKATFVVLLVIGLILVSSYLICLILLASMNEWGATIGQAFLLLGFFYYAWIPTLAGVMFITLALLVRAGVIPIARKKDRAQA